MGFGLVGVFFVGGKLGKGGAWRRFGGQHLVIYFYPSFDRVPNECSLVRVEGREEVTKEERGRWRERERRERERERACALCVCVELWARDEEAADAASNTREREHKEQRRREHTTHAARKEERTSDERTTSERSSEREPQQLQNPIVGGWTFLFDFSSMVLSHGNGVLCRVLSYKSPEHGSACHGAETKRPPPTTRARATEKEKRK